MFNKIKKSQKLNLILNYAKDIPFYIADIATLIYCFFHNIIKFQYIYDKNFVIVTGSDTYFFNTLKQLLDNLIGYKFVNKIIVYDLGMRIEEIEELKSKYKNVYITKFDFRNHEKFIAKRDTHGTLGAYAWKPNIIWKELVRNKSKVIWLDSANLIDWKFIYVLIVLTSKGFFSPMSAKRVKDLTYITTINSLGLSDKYLNKRNLTGGFVCFDWNNLKSREFANLWKDKSNIEELILPKDSTKSNHRWDQSILTVLNYKLNYFGYVPKIKKIFGIKVNQNPNQDFFLYYEGDDEELINFYSNWYKENKIISTKTIKYSKLIWLLSFDSFKKIPKKYLKRTQIICNIDSVDDFKKFYNSSLFNHTKQLTTRKPAVYEYILNSELNSIKIILINDEIKNITQELIEVKDNLINQ